MLDMSSSRTCVEKYWLFKNNLTWILVQLYHFGRETRNFRQNRIFCPSSNSASYKVYRAYFLLGPHVGPARGSLITFTKMRIRNLIAQNIRSL